MSLARSYLFTVPGAEQAADLLTKALAAARITELAAIWGLLDHSLVCSPRGSGG